MWTRKIVRRRRYLYVISPRYSMLMLYSTSTYVINYNCAVVFAIWMLNVCLCSSLCVPVCVDLHNIFITISLPYFVASDNLYLNCFVYLFSMIEFYPRSIRGVKKSNRQILDFSNFFIPGTFWIETQPCKILDPSDLH